MLIFFFILGPSSLCHHKDSGIFALEKHSNIFVQCSNGKAVCLKCPHGLVFSDSLKTCVRPSDKKSTTTTTTTTTTKKPHVHYNPYKTHKPHTTKAPHDPYKGIKPHKPHKVHKPHTTKAPHKPHVSNPDCKNCFSK